MGFIEEIVKKTGAAAVLGRVTLFGNYCFIEGVKRVLCITPTRIEVQTAEGRLSLTGEGLFLREYTESDVLVSGKLRAVERL